MHCVMFYIYIYMIYISNTTLYTLNTYNLHWLIILYAKQDVKKAEFMGDVEFFS